MIKVAVIDDDPEILNLLSSLLKDSGFALDCAQTPEAFLDLVRNDRHDVALIDFWLGHETALALLDKIETEGLALPIVLISGGGGGHSAEIAEALGNVSGIAAFLHKPFRRDELVRTLSKFAG